MNCPRRNPSKYCVCARARAIPSHARICANSYIKRNTELKTLRVRTCAGVCDAHVFSETVLKHTKKTSQNTACAHVRTHFRRTRAFARTAIKHCVCARARVLALCTRLRKLLENTACAHVRGRGGVCFGSGPGRGRGARYTVSYGYLRVRPGKRV